MNNTHPINSVTEALTLISDLTRNNLAILKTIEESFRTRRTHLAVDVNGATYTIPSFISLETRIETLEQNLENVLNAPLTGEAFTYFDGTTQKLELSGYSSTPNHVELSQPRQFNVNPNNIFKDFMNPNPYIRLNLAEIPNSIKHVNIRKVVVHSTDLKNMLDGLVTPQSQIKYTDWATMAYSYQEGLDYDQYDTIKRLPLRQGLAQGTYNIVSIEDHHIDANFEEHYTVVLDKDLVYYVNNGTLQRDIAEGDRLVTYNDKVQMVVESVNPLTKTLTFKILYGTYSDLEDTTSRNPELYTLKYYHAANDNALREFDRTKYVDIPLEEDQYIMVFVAPLNDTTNVQAPWGTGIWLNVDNLVIDIDGVETGFRDYYNQYVNNVGDALVAITSMMDDDEQITRLTPAEFQNAISFAPTWDESLIKVTQINKHLNDAKSIQEIRRLYAQKGELKKSLTTIQDNIDRLNKELGSLSFDDTPNQRELLEKNLQQELADQVDKNDALLKVCQEISLQANQSDVPIENAKYRIRGFMPLNTVGLNSIITPIKIEVQYRYKCSTSFTGAAETYGNDGYIFSDWNIMGSTYRSRIASSNGIQYQYGWAPFNETLNEPSFNQIDIPITQGEKVDMRVRYIYNLGYPFVEMYSAWSPINTIEFPDDLKQTVEILDIITQNNDDIEQHSLENILNKKGLLKHVDDTTQDQTTIYKHKAENITSGFVTPERRIIPLSEKLISMDDYINDLRSEVYGASADNLLITLSSKDNAIQLKPWTINTFHAGSYVKAVNEDSIFQFKNEDNPYIGIFAVSQLNLNIKNVGTFNMKLHTLFPGDHDALLRTDQTSSFNPNNYLLTNDEGIFMMMDENVGNDLTSLQRCNQSIYFRTKLESEQQVIYDHFNNITDLIVDSDPIHNGIPDNHLCSNNAWNIIEYLDPTEGDGNILWTTMAGSDTGSCIGALYPYPGQMSEICLPANETFIIIKPGESINIPIQFVYWFQSASDDNLASIIAQSDHTINPVPLSPNLNQLKTTLGIDSTETDETIIKASLKVHNNSQPYKISKQQFTSSTKMRNLTVTRMMAFDIRTSLFREPITYKFTVDASYDDTKGFKIKAKNISESGVLPVKTVVPQIALTKMITPTTQIKTPNSHINR